MKIDSFIVKIEEEFDDLEPGLLKPNSVYKQVVNWNSMNALLFIIMIETEFSVLLKDEDFLKGETVQELFDKIKNHKD